MFDLTNKIVLIVGGRGYLGRDFCQALRSQNASVISADLPTQSQAASKSEFKKPINRMLNILSGKYSISSIDLFIFSTYKLYIIILQIFFSL